MFKITRPWVSYRRVLFALSLMFLTGAGFTQEKGDDLIVLKNGTSYQGIIIEQKPGVHIKLLQLPQQDTLRFSVDQIELIQKIVPVADSLVAEEPIDQITAQPIGPTPEHVFNQRPFYITAGYSMGGGDWSSMGLGLRIFYTLKPLLQVGVGITMRGGYENSNNPITQSFPLTLEGRYAFQELWGGRGALLACFSGGYNFLSGNYPINTTTHAFLSNGAYLQPGIGYRLNFTKNTGLTLELSYQYMGTAARHEQTDEIVKRHHYSSVLATLALFF